MIFLLFKRNSCKISYHNICLLDYGVRRQAKDANLNAKQETRKKFLNDFACVLHFDFIICSFIFFVCSYTCFSSVR